VIAAVVATLNLPRQIRGRKARLYPHPKRTNAAIRLWNRTSVEVVSLQELGTVSRLQIRARRRWGLVTTTNDIFPLQRVGNGVAWRKDRWLLVGRETIHVDTPTHPKRGLRYPVVTLENRDEPTVRLVVIAVHIPTARAMGEALRVHRDSPKVVAARNKLNGEVLNVAERFVARGLPVVIAGDFNDGAILDVYQSWARGAQHQVDWILGKGLRFAGSSDVETGRISDHPMMPVCTANLTIPRN
jgi:hypothetical protein